MHDVAQQGDERVQPRLGADEGVLAQLAHSSLGLLQHGGRLVVDLLGAGVVEAAQPAVVGRGSLLEVRDRVSRVSFRRGLLDRVQVVIEQTDQLALRHRTAVGVDEVRAEERQNQGRIRLAQQPPRAVPFGELFDLVVIHSRSVSACRGRGRTEHNAP